ncbi:helix-turn-helix domain-containing protein [Pseudonocardia nematodicida]|uniref:Helix-turn-helix domain-containing protein n=1 Tax=Pseudonocardia nematodicida TaxID=1206997 RepID=A0ABV1K3Y8_9PSEU
MSHRVAVLALPGLVTADLGCALQVFGPGALPGVPDAGDEIVVCGAGGAAVPTGDGFDLVVRHGPGALAGADTVVVPGYVPGWDAAPPADVLDALRRAGARGACLVAISVGTFALGHAGLLRGHRATTHPAAARRLAERFPGTTVPAGVPCVVDGNLLSCAGPAHADELARLLGRGEEPGAHHPVPVAALRSALSDTCWWALQHLDRPLGLADLAGHANLSERSLLRHFHDEVGTSPKQWLLGARLDRARRLLETTTLPVDAIARLSGFPSSDALRARFTASFGVPPTTHRRAAH